MIPHLITQEPFVPHTLEHLNKVHAFPSPLPPQAYSKMLESYQALGDVKVWRIAYDSDHLTVTGLLAEPENWSRGAHPLVIYNRGGSREFGKLTLLSAMRSMVPYAQKGYLVAASNYRGTDGGDGVEEFGGNDVNDVLRLIERASEHPGFDGRNVYMIGHSRGAMMTYLALRRGAPVNAAVGLAGMADLFQTAQERPDIEEHVFHRLIVKNDKSREEEYKNRSVVYWAGELTVPIQLHHGDADNRVHVNQSQKLADILKQHGITHELLVWPGDNHALLRNWDKVIHHTLDWMERFRK
jgi:dipeptidyl aminopeptidase/acylaminoacyl peptidase